MNHSNKLVSAGALALLSNLAAVGAARAAPPGDPPEIASPRAAAAADPAPLPAGLDAWLREQCPDGRALRLTRAADAHEIACAPLREELLADAAARSWLVEAYTAQTASSPTSEPPGERVGEAREPGVISGLICGLAVTFFLGRQCDKARLDWASCAAGSVPPQLLCTVIGWTPALP
jgi:hypothetical protein